MPNFSLLVPTSDKAVVTVLASQALVKHNRALFKPTPPPVGGGLPALLAAIDAADNIHVNIDLAKSMVDNSSFFPQNDRVAKMERFKQAVEKLSPTAPATGKRFTVRR